MRLLAREIAEAVIGLGLEVGGVKDVTPKEKGWLVGAATLGALDGLAGKDGDPKDGDGLKGRMRGAYQLGKAFGALCVEAKAQGVEVCGG